MDQALQRGTTSTARSIDVARRQCQANAIHVFRLAQRSTPTVGFDPSGVAWLDAYIETSRSHLEADLVEEFVHMMGSFYGECLIGAFGGVWTLADNQEAAVWMQTHGFTYPLAAVRRQLLEPGAPAVAARYEAAVSFHSALAA